MTKHYLLMVCCFALCYIASANGQINLEADKDATVVPIKDISAPDSPLKISGEWRFKFATFANTEQLSYQEHTIATNVSGQKIIAYVVSIPVAGPTGPLDTSISIDSFFAHTQELAPGQRFEIRARQASESSGDAPDNAATNRRPESHVEAKVIFVQFDGGATFGDAGDPMATELLQRRAKTLEALHRLADIAEENSTATMDGKVKVEEALATKQDDAAAENTMENLRYVRQRDGSAAAIARAKEMLSIAAKHGIQEKP